MFPCDLADPLCCFIGSDCTKHSERCGSAERQFQNSLRRGDCPFPRAMSGNLASLQQNYISGTFFSSSSDSLITFSSLLYLSSVTVASRCFIASSWSWHTTPTLGTKTHKIQHIRLLEWNQDKTISFLHYVLYTTFEIKQTTRICLGQVVDITEVFPIWIWHICLTNGYYEGHIKRNIIVIYLKQQIKILLVM